jgi:hypothetical protein
MGRHLPPSQKEVYAWKSIRLDTPILFAVAAVLIAIGSIWLIHQRTDSFIVLLWYPLSVLFLLATLGYSLFETGRRCLMRDLTIPIRGGRVISAALGAFLIGLISLLIANDWSVKIISGCLCVGTLFIVTLILQEVLRMLENERQFGPEYQQVPSSSALTLRASLPAPSTLRRGPVQLNLEPGRSAHTGVSPELADTQSVPPYEAVLPPLFQNDPLHQLPRVGTTGKLRFFVQAKNNDEIVNCEDACVISHSERGVVLALCDGTSSSNLPRPWATLLAKQWENQPLMETDINALQRWLQEPRQQWEAWVTETWLPTLNQRNRLQGRPPLSGESVQEIMKLGAAATFLGLVVNYNQQKWAATAIGDTCLFHFRPAGQSLHVIETFPLQHSAQFNDTPALLSSRPSARLNDLKSHFYHRRASYQPGDIFVAATDALAAWIFEQIEQDINALLTLFQIPSQQEFADFVNQQRNHGTMHDDDTSMVIVVV